MKENLYCYYGEIDGKKKVAIPRIYGESRFTSEYDIFTINIEKNEGDIRGKYVLNQDIDAVFNKREFKTKKYRFNSFNFKNPATLKREYRIVMLELENKSSISLGGKIVDEEPIVVADNTYVEVARNFEFNDSPQYIQKLAMRCMPEIEKITNLGKEETSDSDNIWKEELLTIEDLGLQNINAEFIGEEIYSEGSSKFLGYNSELGVTVYEDWAAESYLKEKLSRKNQKPILGLVIYKDFIRITVDDSGYKIDKNQDWKNNIGEIFEKFINEFNVKYTMVLQQVEDRDTPKGKVMSFMPILRKESIYNK